MDKIKIITDSTADLPSHLVEKYDIEVLPLLVNINGKSYRDGIDINLRSLLDLMELSEEFPTTSQVNPKTFLDSYKRYLNEGYKIISIHISSKMSGVYQSAKIAKEMLDTGDIHIIDSRNVTAGLGLLVLKACKLREEGKSAAEINEAVMGVLPHVKSALVFDSLENLVRGGRLPKAAGKVGNMLGIKLIMEVGDGEMKILDKVRGSKRAVKYVTKYVSRLGIKSGETSVLLHVESRETLPALRENLTEGNVDFFECEVGCVVGVHAGPGACGVFFIENF
ncbi:MAG: degv family protein [Firmicutes bacterium]|nr:degv family protein [Bacillota bacterium]